MKKKDPTSHRIIEKRRRDRMNNCLADLSKLIPAHYMKKGRGRIEKTEIIEMAIKHLKDLIGQTSASSNPSSSANTSTSTSTNINTATLATTAAASNGLSAELADSTAVAAPTTTQLNGIKPNARPNAQAAHYRTGGQVAPLASRHKHSTQTNPLNSKSAEQVASSLNSSPSSSLSSLSPSDNGPLTSPLSDNSCMPMMICSDTLEPPRGASRSKRKATPILVPDDHQRHHQVNSFISDQDFEHLANVNKRLATIKMEPNSPPALTPPLPLPSALVSATTGSTTGTGPPISNKSYHNHFHSGSSSQHHHHHHHHHDQTSANSACFNGSATSACPLNAPVVATDNDRSGGSSEGGLATKLPPASSALTSSAHQHHHQLHKYRSSPNSSGSDSGGSSSSYGSSGDNGAGSSGNMSGSSSGHRADGSSYSMRTSCSNSSSSVNSINSGNPNRPIGLVVDRGTTTSLQVAMAAATVTVNKPLGADTSAGSSSSSLNSISSDVMMASSPVRSLPGSSTIPSGAAAGAGDGVTTECCTCGARILQTLKQQKANSGGGSSSDSSISSNGACNKSTTLANKSQSANNQINPDSFDFSAKTMSVASKQAMTSNKRWDSNGDNKCNSLAPGFMRPHSTRHLSNSSTDSHLSSHSSSNSTSSSTSSSSVSLTSSNSSAAWYKKAWLVRSFSRSPTPR